MKKKIICIVIPIFTTIFTCLCLESFLDKKIESMLKIKDISSINNEYGSIYKDRGLAYNKYLTDNDYVILQGSSELGSPVSQLATNLFPIKGMENFATNGRSYTQTLQHASIIGSQEGNKERNITIIISIQWFMEKNGIDATSFQANFAPVQFYNYLENEKISEENKRKYTSRINELLDGSSQVAPEKLYSELYSNDGIMYKALKVLFTPYFKARKYVVELKDKGLLYKSLKNAPGKSGNIQLKEIDWAEGYEKAENEAKSKVTNNEYYVYDDYYNLHLKDNEESQKDVNKNKDLMNSEEFSDYELYLDTCVDLGIKPYIILMPTNGRWYDHTGLSKEKRDEFYDKAEELGKKRGFEVLNLKEDEYTPYFMCDVMHFGWEGWFKVDEEIYKHFKK